MNNILKNVCSAQKLHGAEHAGSMEHREMEERNSRYRCLKMKAAAAWALAVLLSLLSVFGGEVSYVNEIQMSLAALVLLFPGNAFYAAARKQLCAGRIGLDTLIAFGASVAFLFSLFNTFFPDYWLRVGLHPYVYYEVAVLVVAVGLTGKVFRFLPEERHGADRIARIFFPVLAGTAVAVFFIWIFWGGMTAVPHAFYAVVSVFIVACPCALGLVAPLALTRGIGRAADMHIRIKDSLALERLDKADVVVFDKTGTLTEGLFEVREVHVAPGVNSGELLGWVASAERTSTHPVARAVVQYAEREGVALLASEGAVEIAGHGIRAEFDGKQLLVGNTRLMARFGVEYPSEVDAIPETIVVCALDGRYAGYLVIADKPKEDAARTVAELKSLGIEDIRILSGDREALVANLGRTLGVSEARGDLLPEGKMEILEALRGEPGKVTAFVGDGFNDAPALATSDVGVAMGALGSDAAIETADVVIQSDQPSRLPAAIRIGRLTHRIVRQNILLAIGVKVVVLTLGALGIATMWEAVFADVGVTLLAVLNAVRASNRRF